MVLVIKEHAPSFLVISVEKISFFIFLRLTGV